MCQKQWVTWQEIKTRERQKLCRPPSATFVSQQWKTQVRYPPTWIGAGNSPCSCSPGVYSSFSFFSWIRRLLGLWRTGTQPKTSQWGTSALARNGFSVLVKAQMSGASGKKVIIELAKELLSRLSVQHTDPSPPTMDFFSMNAVKAPPNGTSLTLNTQHVI